MDNLEKESPKKYWVDDSQVINPYLLGGHWMDSLDDSDARWRRRFPMALLNPATIPVPVKKNEENTIAD